MFPISGVFWLWLSGSTASHIVIDGCGIWFGIGIFGSSAVRQFGEYLPPSEMSSKHWDLVIRAFFIKTGLTQTLKGFEDDMLVFNPEWERLKIPLALGEMIKGLTVGFFLVLNFYKYWYECRLLLKIKKPAKDGWGMRCKLMFLRNPLLARTLRNQDPT